MAILMMVLALVMLGAIIYGAVRHQRGFPGWAVLSGFGAGMIFDHNLNRLMEPSLGTPRFWWWMGGLVLAWVLVTVLIGAVEYRRSAKNR